MGNIWSWQMEARGPQGEEPSHCWELVIRFRGGSTLKYSQEIVWIRLSFTPIVSLCLVLSPSLLHSPTSSHFSLMNSNRHEIMHPFTDNYFRSSSTDWHFWSALSVLSFCLLMLVVCQTNLFWKQPLTSFPTYICPPSLPPTSLVSTMTNNPW